MFLASSGRDGVCLAAWLSLEGPTGPSRGLSLGVLPPRTKAGAKMGVCVSGGPALDSGLQGWG